MNVQLLVLCLSGFALVAVAVSALLYLGLPFFDRLASDLQERHRVALWFGLAALPTAIGFFSIVASFFPAWGLSHDHCLSHGPHHPHLCPDHLGGAPGLILFFIAGGVGLRVALSSLKVARLAYASRQTARILRDGSSAENGAFVFPSDDPEAFVVGLLRPQVFVSRALMRLGATISEPVLAHERVHAHRRDSLWRVLAAFLSFGHLPLAAELLRARLIAAQEFAADDEGARALCDGRVRMAEALVRLAKVRSGAVLGLSFVDGDVKARVSALLGAPRRARLWPARILWICALLLPVVVGLAHDFIHHELETLLGALS